ncbi:tail fiber protein [Sphingomonas sp. AOB5]|uniref:phage tail protein n=1 Tax=Sphingomonas sp. AOB5 TaxID=3034017 RepID=UPI0023F69B5A|nr:tail fiber protein [Sphingomonas sp. AOB5]MDF7777496.1 tail fiber protein [Sphingomonas sp. AOB5]
MGYLGEIRMFSGDFAPEGWALCDGALMPIATHEALYSLIGTAYGGDGVSDFKLPDMRGRVPISMGTGPGLTPRPIGQEGGSETVSIDLGQLPSHTHAVNATSVTATTDKPGPTVNLAASILPVSLYAAATAGVATARALGPAAVGMCGGQSGGAAAGHANMMPSFTVNFIISMSGEYPDFS